MYKFEVFFTASGKQWKALDYSWDQFSAQYKLMSKDEFFFDANDNDTLYINSGMVNGQWVSRAKNRMTYDNNGLLVEQRNFNWSGGVWENRSKTTVAYSSSGNTLQKIWYKWDADSVSWELNRKTESTFNGDEGEHITYMRNGTQWVYYIRIQFTDSNDVVERVVMEWDAFGNVWENSAKYVREVFQGGMSSDARNYRWENNSWVGISRSVATFTGIEDHVDEYLSYTWDHNALSWQLTSKRAYFYTSTVGMPAALFPDASASFFPNPTNGKIHFADDFQGKKVKFEIFDLKGRRVCSKHLLRADDLDLSQLNSGIYIYKLNEGGKTLTGKLLID